MRIDSAIRRFTRHLHARKLLTLKRLAMAHGLSGALPLYVVNEFPKSGGTWVAQMLAAALGLPFFEWGNPRITKSVLKGHFLRPGGLRNTTIVWRDGRDVMVSFYHHCYFKFEDRPFNHGYVELMRKMYPFEDFEAVEANLPAFIEQQFSHPVSPMFTWVQFVDRWAARHDVVHTHYEAMRRNPKEELARISSLLTGREPARAVLEEAVERFSLARQKAAHEPVGHSFVRRGAVGEWKSRFSLEASRIFEKHAGRCLDRLGYERDSRL